MEAIRIGGLYDDKTKHQAGAVWDKDALSPTIDTAQGGNRQPMIVEAISTNGTAVSGCIRASYYKNGERNIVENVMNKKGYEGVVEKSIVAMRGRNPENPSDRTVGIPTEQRLEPNSQGICNTLTSVQKDNLVMEKQICAIDEQNLNLRNETFGTLTTDGSSPKHNNRVMEYSETHYRIRKLTPKECWRLMDFLDEDFHKAEAVNSNTQLYKQAGNSIVRNVLVAILGQMIPGKEEVYKDMQKGA